LDYNGTYDFEAFKSTVAKFQKAGVVFYITELDVGLPKGEIPGAADWETIEPLQAEMFYQIIKAAREAGVSLISVWGITDALEGGWRGGERALLFDKNFKPKPSFEAVLRALIETAEF
jgi:GH35 family endo-1,4-beta-xylanase